jgi:hypothetical protein
MKRQQSGKKSEQQVKLWTYPEAAAALPYVNSILRSLREHTLEGQARRLELKRLEARQGRPGRGELIKAAELRRRIETAEDRYSVALDELLQLGVGCSDVLNGEAMFPFLYDNKVAWFHHSLFDGDSIYWRFDSDSPETRRAVSGESRPKSKYLAV